ncbi:MAG: hypothetical protein ACI9G1_000105 [Pirellulaceae bacterium]|jgi:hypothetical protein
MDFPFHNSRSLTKLAVAMLWIWTILVAGLVTVADLDAQLTDSFESSSNAWQLVQTDCETRVLQQQRTLEIARQGKTSEFLKLHSKQGTLAYLGYQLSPARIISELRLSIWLRSDHSRLQLMVRVVLPRSKAPNTDDPIKFLLTGSTYQEPGAWQQLTLNDCVDQLSKKMRLLRSEFGSHVDSREAYIDMIVINAYGGAGVTNLWIDDLRLTGYIPAETETSSVVNAPPNSGTDGIAQLDPRPVVTKPIKVTLDGSILIANDQPVFVRGIDYRGEDIQWLRQRGFNTLVFKQEPTEEQWSQIAQNNFWAVCPPPTTTLDISQVPLYRRALCWSVGDELTGRDLQTVEEMARRSRQLPTELHRPIVANCRNDLWTLSRAANIVSIRCPSLSGNLDWEQIDDWIRIRRRETQPGTPFWAEISSEPDASLAVQLHQLGHRDAVQFDPEQLRLLTHRLLSTGVRGIVFRSNSRLDGSSPQQETRAKTLELLNHEMTLIQPWLAGGQFEANLEPPNDDTRVSVLQTERSRLLFISHREREQQFALSPSIEEQLTLTIPNTFSSPYAYHISSTGVRPLDRKRVAGGLRVIVSAPTNIELVALTHDPKVVRHLTRQGGELAGRVNELRYELAMSRLEQLEFLVSESPENSIDKRYISQQLTDARQALGHAVRFGDQRDQQTSATYLQQVNRIVTAANHRLWRSAVRGMGSPLISPLCLNSQTLPAHWRLANHLSQTQFATKYSSDMRSVEQLVRAGWKNFRSADQRVATQIQLSPTGGVDDSQALQITTSPAIGSAPSYLNAPAAEIVSPLIPIESGKIVRISGMIKTIGRLEKSPEGLLIYDSITGRDLGYRLYEANQWTPFILYRAVASDAQLQVVFEVNGLGTVWIDNFHVETADNMAPALARKPQRTFWQE